jgi:hypothetical protein
LGKEDKKRHKSKYLELLDVIVEEAKSYKYLAQKLVPALLKLDVRTPLPTALLSEPQKEITEALVQYGTLRPQGWLYKIPDTYTFPDITSLTQNCTPTEREYLVKHNFTEAKPLIEAYNTQNHEAIRKFKSTFYTNGEKEKLQQLQSYFGEDIWTYFFDKVHTTRPLAERFRAPHDALEHTNKLLQLAEILETKKHIPRATFLDTILSKIPDSNAGYQTLNTFLISYQEDWQSKVQEELQDPDGLKDPHFLQLASEVLEQDASGALYTSLDNLQKITTLTTILSKKRALKTLEPLTQSDISQDKIIGDYYTKAIYHPRTKPIILEMYTNPKKFLGLDDTTFSALKPIHDAKKPVNMVEHFPYLDLEAKDLVNCLPLGVYDQISYFQPMRKQYLITKHGSTTVDSLKQEVVSFLSSLSNKQKGDIVKGYNEAVGKDTLRFQSLKDAETLTSTFATRDWEQLQSLLFVVKKYNHLRFIPYENAKLMTAEIAPKSDPTNRFNGFNCDAISANHGKKVVAMFNPYCTDFCVYEGEKSDQQDHLKVTSRVTLNRNIPYNFASLLEQIKETSTHDIAKILGQEFADEKDPSEYILTLDNIEADANFEKKNAVAIREIYEDFFAEYIKVHPHSPNGIPLNTQKILCGKNYGKMDVFNKEEANTTLPVFVNGYTDNAQSTSLVGTIQAGEQADLVKKTGIHELSIEDVIPISYLEGKIYPENMKDHIGNLQHEITASILNNKRL